MRYLIIFLFLFLCNLNYSQNKGSLEFDFSIEEDDKYYHNQSIDFLLLKNDSVYFRDRYCMLDDHTWTIDSVEKDTYHLKILFNDTLLLLYPQIKVIPNKLNNYKISIFASRRKLKKHVEEPDTITPGYVKAELTINTLYGNNSYDQPTYRYRNEMVSGEFGISLFPLLTKYYTLGLKIGAQYGRTEFYNDTTHVNGEQILSKHYSYGDLNIGLVNRITFYNNKLDKNNGLKLDLGLLYHLPLFFREVEKIDYDTKKKTRHIHTYTDFTAMARLGYKYIGVQAEYSLFNFLKRNYIENPQLRVGIVFFIPTDQD